MFTLRSKSWVVALALPLVLFGVALAFRDAVSWRPQLVATHPDGSGEISWSRDGQLVCVTPSDWQQIMEWGNTYFNVKSRVKEPNGEERFVLPRAELRANSPTSDAELKAGALAVCFQPDGACRVLRGASWELFGLDQLDASTSMWRFQASQLAPDEREISVLSAAQVYVWSTRTGQLLRRVPLAAPKKSVQSAWFSPDRKWLLTRILSSLSESDGQLALFDATRGTRRFTFPWGENGGAGFSPSGKVFWVASSSPQLPNEGSKISFYEVRSGQKLWNCLQHSDAPPLFALRGEVFIVGTAGLERRLSRSGRLMQNIRGPVSSLRHMALSPDASQIWSSHDDGQIWSWRVR